MSIFSSFRGDIEKIIDDLAASGALPPGVDTGSVTVEPPRNADHGDLTTNAAMVLAKPAKQKPRDLAGRIADLIRSVDGVAEVEIAGPGFINVRLDAAVWREELRGVLRAGVRYGDSDIGAGTAVNVEFVSANPTGPLHVGHCRGAVFGAALATLLSKTGFKVTSEYYVNDAGAQVNALARSVHLRYREALGEQLGEIPSGLYPGEYLVPVGQDIARREGDKWRAAAEEEWLPEFRALAVKAMMAGIREDLELLGISFDVYTSEGDLHRSGSVQAALDDLDAKGLIYTGVLEPPKGKTPDDWEARPQTLFRATEFGDATDRPLKKADGDWTYFASDIAYHRDKIARGFNTMINVWGADHGGYVKRMKAAVRALSDGKAELDVKLCQLVKVVRGGVPVKMSKRAGEFITLRDVLDEVGKDVVRYIMLTRKNDAPLDFDFDRVVEQTRDNPVFYVQYAHARIRSVLRKAASELPELDLAAAALADADLETLQHEAEVALIKTLADWPRTVESAALAHEPHRIAYYLDDLAAQFHALWNLGTENPDLRFLIPQDVSRSRARLALIQGVAQVIASGLEIMGVEPVEEMR